MNAALHPLQIQALAVRAKFFPKAATRLVRPRAFTSSPDLIPACSPWAAPDEDGAYPLDYLIELSAYVGKVSVMRIKSIQRDAHSVRARQVCCWLARNFTGCSFPVIAKQLGDRDHTTVISAVRRVDKIVAIIEAPAEHSPRPWAEALLSAEWPARNGRWAYPQLNRPAARWRAQP